MKKILTVLLALSVVFTYTVGTAFAAVPTTEEKTTLEKNVDNAATYIKSTLTTNYNAALNTLDGDDPITAEQFKAAAEIYKNAQLNIVDQRAAEMKAEYAKQGSDYISDTSYDNILNNLFTEAKNTGFHKFTTDPVDGSYVSASAIEAAIKADNDVKIEAATLAFNEAKEDTMAIIKALDLSEFSTTIQTINGEETSYYALAQKAVAQLSSQMDATVIAENDDYATIKTKVSNILGFKNKYFDAENAYAGYHLSAAARAEFGLLTMDEEENNANTLEAKKALKLAQVQAKAAKVLSDLVNADDYTTVVVPTVNAYVLAQEYLIEAANSETELNDLVGTPDKHGITSSTILENVKAIEELESVAAKYKLLKDDSGNLLKDAEAIDEVVHAAKLNAYQITTRDYDNTNDINKIKNGCDIKAAKTTFVVESKKAEIEDARDAVLYNADGSDKYYAPEKARVNELFDSLIAKVDAAATDKEIGKISERDISVQLSLVKDKTAVQTSIKAMSAFKTDMTKLNEYKAYLNAGVSPYSKDYKDFSNYNDDFFADFYAENGVRAAADITSALYDDAKAVLDAVVSNGAIAEAKASVEALINALPAKSAITIADKAQIQAAWTAAESYKDAYGRDDLTNQTTLDGAVSQVLAAEKYDANKIYNELPAKLTVADKAAVKSYQTALEAILATEMYPDNAVNSEIDKCVKALKTIRDLELKAVMDAINALPLNITLADKASVEAARDAYDAFVAEYTQYADSTFAEKYNAEAEVTNIKDLLLAEASINALKIEAVESLKVVKNHSTAGRTNGKSWIKIEWSTVGDDSAVQGYEIYKSTKKNSGYKYSFTTKNPANKWYKNTAGLKKGTRYYYKVRAFVEIDGQKYYSDWSNKAYRIAK